MIMDDETETTTLLGNKIKDALSGVPEEVKTFMWSTEYQIIIDTIQKTLLLTDKEKDLVKYGSYQLLLGIKTMEGLAGEWSATGMNPELIMKILYIIHEEILTRAQNITEFFTRNSDEIDDAYDQLDNENGVEKKVPELNPSNSLATLSDRLKQASIATSAKREYVSGKDTSTPPARVTIDPYHEPVDNG